jgi:hypothetical protein
MVASGLVFQGLELPVRMKTRATYHPESSLRADELGIVIPPYKPTFPGPDYINNHHRFLSTALNLETDRVYLTAPGLLEHSWGQPINGWLRQEDALKLYELGFYVEGNILELGTYEGLSTCILAQAIADSGRAGTLSTVDLSYRQAVADNLQICGVDSRVKIITADAAVAMKNLPPQGFNFIFVDHSHSYDDVKEACLLLPEVAAPGAFVLFHDYNDARNGEEPDYGVYQAVNENLPSQFRFCGVYGCTGLYRAD